MKKNKHNKKGFAMAELLAVSVVILLLFSILFSNYLPLVAEYENRISYTNVTANYAAFYVRKIVKESMENNGQAIQKYIDDAIRDKSYLLVYKEDSVGSINFLVSGEKRSYFLDIIEKYGIEEIIITKYKLDKVKSSSGYKKNSGSLYQFIKYLPKYSQSTAGISTEPYRIILKTTNYGFATTQILADPQTPISCFDLEYQTQSNSFIVKKYHFESDVCGDVVSLPATPVTKNGVNALITSIGKKAFMPESTGASAKKLTSIKLPKNVTSIGEYAFSNNDISKFDFKVNAPGVVSVGNYAFSNNKLSKIVLEDNIQYGDGVFADNYKIKSIKLNFGDSTTPDISDNMFALSNSEKTKSRLLNQTEYGKIDLTIPYNIVNIGKGAFKNIKFSSIDFENQHSDNPGDNKQSKLSQIGENAFAIEDEVIVQNGKYRGDDNYLRIIIPSGVMSVGDYAFQNVQIGNLVFAKDNDGSANIKKIGEGAFSTVKVKITDKVINDFCDKNSQGNCMTDENGKKLYNRLLQIPTSVNEIGPKAFKGQALDSVLFNVYKSDGTLASSSAVTSIGSEAFANNNFKSITLPKSLLNASGQEALGSKIFGDYYDFGNDEYEIIVESASMLDGINNWCQALYGSAPCSKMTPEEVKKPNIDHNRTRIYKSGETVKYISHIG